MEPSKESSDLVGLNVGGIIYKTSRTTLMQNPGSFFARMLEGYIPSAKDDSGNFIIDRDGQVFRHVLNFLRCGRMVVPEDFKEYGLLEHEADFFLLDKLQKAVQEAVSLQLITLVFNDGEIPNDGKLFRTTKNILTREEDSVFTKIFCGDVAALRTSEGHFVMVGDGSLFRHVHSYLQKGGIFTDLDESMLERLQKEASHFSLEVLKQQIQSIVTLRHEASIRMPLQLHVYCWVEGPFVVYANRSSGGMLTDWYVGDICKEHVMICDGVFAGVIRDEKADLEPASRFSVEDMITLITGKTSEDAVEFDVVVLQITKNCTRVTLQEFDASYPVYRNE